MTQIEKKNLIAANAGIQSVGMLASFVLPMIGDSLTDGLQTFRFVQGNANLFGGELTIDLHPHPLYWLHIQNAFSFVQANQVSQPDSTR